MGIDRNQLVRRLIFDEHSAARPRPLTHAERARVAAVATYVVAYIARCEHALGEGRPFARALERYGSGWFSGIR